MNVQERTVLRAENIHREFVTAETVLPVLRGLSLELQAGEMTAVTGASGVGKSTFLHILGGLDRPTRGVVEIGGVSLAQQSEKQLAGYRNQKVGFVFQFHYLMADFSALENVMMPILISGGDRRSAADKAELLLDQVGLTDRINHRPNQLSGGEQQRVAVARALANDPMIVLADEPTGNLDTATGRKLHDLLFHLNAENGITMLIATHNLELAERCRRRVRIEDGQLKE
jgi:lipoprotein-releasing system ATP-binding protein